MCGLYDALRGLQSYGPGLSKTSDDPAETESSASVSYTGAVARRPLEHYIEGVIPRTILKLGTLFENRGHQIRIVGGWVRDTLRGHTPKDLDLSTTALPDETVALCTAHGFDYSDSGLKHGTVGIRLAGSMYEVTTLRVDAETDGRHAVVEFTDDWRADAARRDFTINAMSMDLAGRLYDYFDGYRDLQNRRVSFVGDPAARIKEDYLRILRYYRFKGWLNDELDETATERAITENAPGLRQISAERIWAEMQRILAGGNLKNVLWSMYVTDTVSQIGLDGIDNHDIYRASDARALTENPVTVLAALSGNPLATRWRLSRDEASLLRWLQLDRRRDTSLKPTFDELKLISTTKGLGHAYAVEHAAMHGDAAVHDLIRNWTVPAFPVTGADLMALGHTQGTGMGDVMRLLRERWQQSDYTLTKEALLASLDLAGGTAPQ